MDTENCKKELVSHLSPKVQKKLFGRKLSDKFASTIVSTVIATLAATFLTYLIGSYYQTQQQNKALINSINLINIGSNKEWLDSKFGPAAFSTLTDNDRLRCVYLTDLATLQVFYSTIDNKCEAFFVTLMSKDAAGKITLPSEYSFATDGKALGKLNYYEIEGIPSDVFGFMTRGGRSMYGEEYVYGAIYGGYTFHYLTLDYGEANTVQTYRNNVERVNKDNCLDIYIDDEVDAREFSGATHYLVTDRKAVCPNTFGLSSFQIDDLIRFLIEDHGSYDNPEMRETYYKMVLEEGG